MRDSKKRSSRRDTARKNTRWNKPHLDALIAEATLDAYGESEGVGGFFTMMEDSLALPVETEVLGVKAIVERIDMNEDGTVVAVCRHDGKRQRIPILNLPLRSPEGAEWI